MRLLAFHIRNFRSIVDSGWKSLAHDNITALIGQNESGKTSVLEALKSFYDGKIVDDILRSDMSLPVVSCRFELNEEEIRDISAGKHFPAQIKSFIQSKKEIELLRSWNDDKSSVLELNGPEVLEIYREYESNRQEEDALLAKKVNEIIAANDHLEQEQIQLRRELKETTNAINQLNYKVKDINKAIGKSRENGKTDQLKLDLDRIFLNLDHEKNHAAEIEQILTERTFEYNEVKKKVFLANTVNASVQKMSDSQAMLQRLNDELEVTISMFPMLQPGRSLRQLEAKYKQQVNKQAEAQKQYRHDREEGLFNKMMASKVFSGMDPDTARTETIKEFSGTLEYPGRQDLGNELFKYSPIFGLFEDFSSLLPNRIDLDDLINERSMAEGYKAARNFLVIAGLDARFFDQQNNRILKQKIEKLNGEITVNFQDYWRQSVGKNNKIKLHFELEHYDFKHPEKKGKPYLEFWIKDERDRLYPKQRSRGVRWFLSFYLELKAAALTYKRDQILLIDEPGLSLHARAQEDVLKVFEDIRDKLTIVYTTHSPHLVDTNKLYRILAVQRALSDDETSDTIILDSNSLMQASADTLSPVYTLMGAKISDQQYIHVKNNVIVENAAAYYFLKAFVELIPVKKEVHFIPATGSSNVETLANILTGWKLDFIILLNGDDSGKMLADRIKKNLFGNHEDLYSRKIMNIAEGHCLIDLFSTIDFKNFILKKRVGITEKNSEYIETNEISATVLAIEFHVQVIEGKIKLSDMDIETRDNIGALVKQMENILS
jgi:predicted ATP-binding protein involved in virulence